MQFKLRSIAGPDIFCYQGRGYATEGWRELSSQMKDWMIIPGHSAPSSWNNGEPTSNSGCIQGESCESSEWCSTVLNYNSAQSLKNPNRESYTYTLETSKRHNFNCCSWNTSEILYCMVWNALIVKGDHSIIILAFAFVKEWISFRLRMTQAERQDSRKLYTCSCMRDGKIP